MCHICIHLRNIACIDTISHPSIVRTHFQVPHLIQLLSYIPSNSYDNYIHYPLHHYIHIHILTSNSYPSIQGIIPNNHRTYCKHYIIHIHPYILCNSYSICNILSSNHPNIHHHSSTNSNIVSNM